MNSHIIVTILLCTFNANRLKTGFGMAILSGLA